MVGTGLQTLFNSRNTLLQQVYFPNMMLAIPYSVYETSKSQQVYIGEPWIFWRYSAKW